MKWLAVIFIVVSAAVPALSPTPQSRTARHENIREALLRYQITQHPREASLYFVSVEDDKSGKPTDASDELIGRFAGQAVRIEKASMAKAEGTRAVDIKTGEAGQMVYIGDLRRLSENKVTAYVFIQGESGGVGLRATVEQHNSRWEVLEIKTELFLDYPQQSKP